MGERGNTGAAECPGPLLLPSHCLQSLFLQEPERALGRGHQREPSTADLPCALGGGLASRSLGLLRVKDVFGGAERKRLVGTWRGSVGEAAGKPSTRLGGPEVLGNCWAVLNLKFQPCSVAAAKSFTSWGPSEFPVKQRTPPKTPESPPRPGGTSPTAALWGCCPQPLGVLSATGTPDPDTPVPGTGAQQGNSEASLFTCWGPGGPWVASRPRLQARQLCHPARGCSPSSVAVLASRPGPPGPGWPQGAMLTGKGSCQASVTRWVCLPDPQDRTPAGRRPC